MSIEAHPVADMFPMMSADELGGLIEDIRSHGLREPIWLHPDGRIIDGRNRYRACIEGAVEPTFRTWSDEGSLVDFVLSLNLHRRHLTKSQKAVMALKVEEQYAAEAKERSLANLKRGDEKHAPEVEILPPREQAKSRERAGEALGVSGRYVQQAKRIAEQAPDLLSAVETGEMTIPKASEEASRRNGDRRARSAERAAEARRLAKAGLSIPEIAEALGVSDSSVGNYLKEAGYSPKASDRAAINRLTNQAAGLALAANKISGAVKDPESGEVAQWMGDLTKTIRSLSQLRTRIKEHNQL